MRLYNVKASYISFLRDYDSRVALNKNQARPYVGVLITINDLKYFAPLSSPKPKHLKMQNSFDFRKIGGGVYGAINLNNMIPIPDCALIELNIDNEPDYKYRNLLHAQYLAIRKDEPGIIESASELHDILLEDEAILSDRLRRVKARCCNLTLLETIYMEYSQE